ncbi:MAG: outer membrane protein assembly factor BamB family protein, partial [Planctomycetota bacterium]
AINPDGTEKWRFVTGGDVRSPPAIGADGTIYVGSRDNNLYAINRNGTEKWRFATGGDVYSPAIGADGTIYVGSRDFNLYAINPDGTEKWRFATGGLVSSSPAIGADGTIYVGSYDNNLYAINPDGTEKWRFATGYTVSSSPAIGADGTIYVGSSDSNLYAVYSTSPGLAHTPWPMFHHDLKHTGRVLPLPDIKANGSDGPLTIPYGANLTVTIALDPAGYDGEDCDWWVVGGTPFGLFWYTLDRGWVRSDAPVRVYGGPLFDLSPFEVLNISGLPIGTYTFFFGVDLLMNRSLDLAELCYDSVGVTIE